MIRRTLCTAMGTPNCPPSIDLTRFAQNGRKIIGAALNYTDILIKRGLECPKKPVLFLKPTTSYLEEGRNIVCPKSFTKVVHEVELGVIIKRTCKNVSEDEAMHFVGGYCLALDMTAQCELACARERGHPWSLGKGFDTSTPVSRFIAPSEVPEPNNLELWLCVNGEKRQCGNTRDMIFDIADLVVYASKFMTLEANDLILTGTPDGSSVVHDGDYIECGLGKVVDMAFKVTNE